METGYNTFRSITKSLLYIQNPEIIEVFRVHNFDFQNYIDGESFWGDFSFEDKFPFSVTIRIKTAEIFPKWLTINIILEIKLCTAKSGIISVFCIRTISKYFEKYYSHFQFFTKNSYKNAEISPRWLTINMKLERKVNFFS